MMPSGTSKPLAFSVQTVRWFSQFFRDRFELQFYVSMFAPNGVRRRPGCPYFGPNWRRG